MDLSKGSARFRFAAAVEFASSGGAMRKIFRYVLMVSLLIVSTGAAWVWFRPYSWTSDPAAGCKIEGVQLKRDQSYYWVTVHLTVNPGMTHDLQKNVYLKIAQGATFEPADSTFVNEKNQPVSEIWFKFWLDSESLKSPLTLHLNDGALVIKSTEGIPALEDTGALNFMSSNW